VTAGPLKVVAGDFDGDGHVDLAATYSTYGMGSSAVAVYLGRGHGLFAPAVEYAVGAQPEDAAAVDLDRDGRFDLVTANSLDGTVSVFLGRGDGTFHDRVDYPAGSGPVSLQVGDLDGDGVLDLVVANRRSDGLSVLVGKGDGSFHDAVTTALPGAAWVALGDFTGDGRLDVASCDATALELTVFPGKGDGTLLEAKRTPVQWCPTAAVVADLDRDGKLDLAALPAISTPSLWVLRGKGDGTFLVGDLDNSGPWGAVQALDLDKDGRVDLALTGSNGQSNGVVAIRLGNANGTFRTAVAYDVGQTPVSIAAADLDGDGLLDLAVANQSTSTLSVLLGKGSGTLAALPKLSVPEAPYGIISGDLQGDGKADLIALAGNKAIVFLGTGGGSFAAGVSYSLPTQPEGTILADVNGDGRPDLVSAVGDKVDVLLNTGSGAFRGAVEYAVWPETYRLAVGDFDGDGHQDIVSVGIGQDLDGPIQFLKGNGDGTFRAPIAAGTLPVHGAVAYVLAGNLDGDGKLDLVVGLTFASSGTRVVARGKGDGTFDVGAYQTDSDLPPAALVDVDGDGRLDLVRGAYQGVTVELGLGDGTFAGAAAYGEGAYFLTLADLDDDGRLDVVATSFAFYSGHQTMQLLRNRGDGTFGSPVDFGAGVNPYRLAVADLDGDGRKDVAAVGLDAAVRLLYSTCLP
jgi:hypothetical protein